MRGPLSRACAWLLTAVSLRTLTGLGILVCSMDGSVAFLDFSKDELGDPLSEEEKVGAVRLWGPCSLQTRCFLKRPWFQPLTACRSHR